MAEYEARFYENDEYLPDVSKEFMGLAEGHTYQYFDISVGTKRISIPQYHRHGPHPPHHERWPTCISPHEERFFRGARVLDMASSEGFWALKAKLAGAREVVMVERSPNALACAEFIFDFLEVDPPEMICDDLTNYGFKADFDIAFMMRVWHWFDGRIPEPEKFRDSLMKAMAERTKKLFVVNMDEKDIPGFLEQYGSLFPYCTHGGEGFMGWIRFCCDPNEVGKWKGQYERKTRKKAVEPNRGFLRTRRSGKAPGTR